MLGGHIWTVAPFVLRGLRPVQPPSSRHVTIRLPDATYGAVNLTARLRSRPQDRELVVVVHGMGGNAAAPYVVEAARAAEAEGIASLRVNLRGADRRGEDYYHAGLSSDLHGILRDPALAQYDSVYFLGYSLGGHIALRAATEPHEDRLRGVAAVCPPVDLARGAGALDRMHRRLYRAKLLANLKEVYHDVAARRPVPIPLNRADRISTIREWDERVVAPRWGFRGASEYYAASSVGPHLHRIRIPAVVVAARKDPMVLAETVQPQLDRAATITTRWVDRGGHIGFPRHLDLGLGGVPGIARQLIGWMRRRART